MPGGFMSRWAWMVGVQGGAGAFTYLGCKTWGPTSLGMGGELQGPTLWLRTV